MCGLEFVPFLFHVAADDIGTELIASFAAYSQLTGAVGRVAPAQQGPQRATFGTLGRSVIGRIELP